MSKKNEETSLMPTALAGVQVEAGIDMRLTKSDLIEMAVEERKEELEKLINHVACGVHAKEAVVRDLRHGEAVPAKLKESVAKLMESEYKVLLKAFRAAVPEAKTDITQRFDHAYEIFRIEDPTQEHGSRSRSEKLTKVRLVDRTENCDRYGEKKKAFFTMQFQLGNHPDNCGYNHKKPAMYLALELEAPKALVDAWRDDCKKAFDEYVEVYNQLIDLKMELAELGRKGGRYKAELTKRLLGGTTAGKELLGAMKSVRALMISDVSDKK